MGFWSGGGTAPASSSGSWAGSAPLGLPTPPTPQVNPANINNLGVLQSALRNKQISYGDFINRFGQLPGNSTKDGVMQKYSPGNIGGSLVHAVNQVLVKPVVNTVKTPINAVSLGTAEATHNNPAITHATTALQNSATGSLISPLAQTAMMGATNLAASKILNKPNSPEVKQAQIKGAIEPGYNKLGFSLKDSPAKTGLKEAALAAQDIATPILTKGGMKAFSDTKALTTSAKDTLNNVAVNNALKTAAKGTKGKTPEVAVKTSPKLGEQGAVNPGAVVKDTQAMLQKHATVNKATGNIEQDYAKLQGRTKDINLDTASVLKNRTPLSNADKMALQDYRDAKAAGQTPAPLPERLQAADANITALNRATQAADAEKARLSGQEAKAQKIESQNPETYTHREALGKGSGLELTVRGDKQNPLSVGGLSKTTSSSHGRTFKAVTDERGNRQVVAVDKGQVTALDNAGKTSTDLGKLNLKTNADRMGVELKPVQTKIDSLENEQKILSATKSRSAAASKRLDNIKTNLQNAYRQHATITNKYDMNELDGKTFTGKDGKNYTVGQAGMREITKATGQKYVPDPELATHLNYASSKVALENTRFVENTKSVLENKQLAFREGETAPKGFKTTSNPYFRGYKLTPKLAEVLDDISYSKSSTAGEALNKVSNVLRQTIVYMPIRHDFNEGAGYIIDRGLTNWLNPAAYVRMGKSLTTATKEVATQGPLYRKMLQEGSTIMGDDRALAKVVQKQVRQTLDNQQTITHMAKSFATNPARMYKAVQQVSVWDVQNILNIARVDERMRPTLFSKGLSFDDALAKTERYNFQYKVPSRAALPGKAGRVVAETLKSDKLYFGAYTYDKFRIAKNILKDTANPKTLLTKPGENLEAANKLAATVAIAAILWPLVDKGLQKVTGDKNAHITAPGVASVGELTQKIIQHKAGAPQVAGQLSVAAPYSLSAQLLENRDGFSGKQIHDPNASFIEKSGQTASWLKSQLAPQQKLATSMNATTNKTLSTALSLAGASLPKNSPTANKLNSLLFDSMARTRTQAKAQAKSGDLNGALNTISAYNNQVLTAAKADLKDKGQPIPDDQTLIRQLKKGGYYYSPKPSTIQGWSQPRKVKPGAFAP